MDDGDHLLKVNVYVSIPDELMRERNVLEEVINRFNKKGNLVDKSGITIVLQPRKWSTLLAPFNNETTEATLNKLSTSPSDLFVGALRLRFDSSLTEDSQSSDSGQETGFEYEFNIAHKYVQTNSRFRAIFLRCIKPIAKSEIPNLNNDEVRKVNKFWSSVMSNKDYLNFYVEYKEISDFEKILEEKLSSHLSNLPDIIPDTHELDKVSDLDSSSHIVSNISKVLSKASGKFSSLKPGHAHDMAFLSVDIVGHSKLSKKHKDKIQELLSNFFTYVQDITKKNNGEIFSWSGDVGLVAFWGHKYKKRAVVAGIEILNNLLSFNLHDDLNPIGEPISIRIAGSCGPIVIRYPTSTIASSDINFAVHLQEKETLPGEFRLPIDMLDNTSKVVFELFSSVGRFEGVQVYSYRVDRREEDVSIERLNSYYDAFSKNAAILSEIIQLDEESIENKIKEIPALIDSIYHPIEMLSRRFRHVDKNRWSLNHTKIIREQIIRFVDSEQSFWLLLRRSFSDSKEFEATDGNINVYSELDHIIDTCASKRAKPIAYLERLCDILKSKISGEEESALDNSVDQGLILKIKQLEKADDLSEEYAMFEILFNYKQIIMSRLSAGDSKFIDLLPINRFWTLADLILQDDIYSSDYHRKTDFLLTRALAKPPVDDSRFKILVKLLDLSSIDSRETIGSQYSSEKLPPGDDELGLILRCLLIGHNDSNTRKFAARQLSFLSSDPLTLGDVGKMITRSNVPLDSLKNIAEQFINKSSDDEKRLFFDCTRSRIEEAIQNAKTKSEIDCIDSLIIFFLHFDFLADELYFSRYDDLIKSFFVLLDRMNVKASRFSEIHSEDSIALLRSKKKGTILRNIKKRPLWIQKKLAGEAPYLFHFINHTDVRIARETLRNINLSNASKVLSVDSINLFLFNEVVKNAAFMTRPAIRTSALLNATCSDELAIKLIPMFSGKSIITSKALEEIVKKAKRPEIRKMAKRQLIRNQNL
jgi:hypothetical protein